MSNYVRKSRVSQNKNRKQSTKRSFKKSGVQSMKKYGGRPPNLPPPARGCNHDEKDCLIFTCNDQQAVRKCKKCDMEWFVPQYNSMCTRKDLPTVARGCKHDKPGALMITCNGNEAVQECRECHVSWVVPQYNYMCKDN